MSKLKVKHIIALDRVDNNFRISFSYQTLKTQLFSKPKLLSKFDYLAALEGVCQEVENFQSYNLTSNTSSCGIVYRELFIIIVPKSSVSHNIVLIIPSQWMIHSQSV